MSSSGDSNGVRVDVSRDELIIRFRDFSDEELLDRLQAGTLTPLAAEVASAELLSRGIESSAATELDAVTESDVGDEALAVVPQGVLMTVAEFWNPVEATLLRTLLESAGIYVHMWGEHLGVAHTFLSVASGGTKVQVPENQAEQAREIIAAYRRGEFALEEDPE
jgi:hypothetical protein